MKESSLNIFNIDGDREFKKQVCWQLPTNEKQKTHSTGIKGLDRLLNGGLFLGENVLLEMQPGTFTREFLYAFMKEGITEGNQVIYLDFIYPPQALMLQLQPLTKTLPKGWEDRLLVLDCFSESSGQGEFIFNDFYDKATSWIRKVPSSRDPESFHRFFGRIEREFVTPGTRLVFNSLSLMEHNWGREAVKTFFGHICPALYAYQTLAYWTMVKDAHPREFCAIIEHMTQVVIELSNEGDKKFLEVKKAGGRYSSQTYQRREYAAKDLEINLL
jgi:KaiC/GvpD/RAD55 family RecA-like ATPase